MITNNDPSSVTSLQDDENLKALSDTLYELTKYDNDLRVFFESCTIHQPVIENNLGTLNVPEIKLDPEPNNNENDFQNDIKKEDFDTYNDLKEVFNKDDSDMFKGSKAKSGSEPNYDENNFQNNTEDDFKPSSVPKTKLDSKLGHNENSSQGTIGKTIATYTAAPIPNNSQIGNQKLNHSTETKLTAGLIYEFLKLEKNSIQLNISKLSDKPQQIANQLLGIEAPQRDVNELFSLFTNNNNKSNTNGQNQNDKSSQLDFDFTKRNSSNELQNSNSQQKSDNKQVNTEEQSTEKLVFLTTDQFKDLIYYLIVWAVAKNKGIDIYATESNVNYNEEKKEIENSFKSKNTGEIFVKLEGYRRKVESQELQGHIVDKSQEQEDQTSFWFPLLLSYLGRASFLYGLYNAIISGDNCKKDVALASPNILFALSLLFGFGAAANLVLGFITLVSLLYKFIDQYPKKRKKYLIYKLVRSKLFRSKLGELDNALTPQVGNFYKRYQALVNENKEIHLKEQNEHIASLNKQYKNVPSLNQNGHQNNLYNYMFNKK